MMQCGSSVKIKQTNIMKIKFACPADAIETQTRLAKMCEKHLTQTQTFGSHSVEWVEPVDVTEGREKCGSGALIISGLAKLTIDQGLHGTAVSYHRLEGENG